MQCYSPTQHFKTTQSTVHSTNNAINIPKSTHHNRKMRLNPTQQPQALPEPTFHLIPAVKVCMSSAKQHARRTKARQHACMCMYMYICLTCTCSRIDHAPQQQKRRDEMISRAFWQSLKRFDTRVGFGGIESAVITAQPSLRF